MTYNVVSISGIQHNDLMFVYIMKCIEAFQVKWVSHILSYLSSILDYKNKKNYKF